MLMKTVRHTVHAPVKARRLGGQRTQSILAVRRIGAALGRCLYRKSGKEQYCKYLFHSFPVSYSDYMSGQYNGAKLLKKINIAEEQ